MSSRHWWVLPLLVVVVVAVGVGAGYGLRELSARAGAGTSGTSTQVPTTTTAAPDETGSRAVRLTADVAADPGGLAIQRLLQRHFDAINAKDFLSWQATVTRQRAAAFPEQRWLEQYRSTTDTDMLVQRVEPATTGSIVLISFVSRQERALAPDQLSDCLRWRVSYAVVTERGELRLGPSDPDASQYSAC